MKELRLRRLRGWTGAAMALVSCIAMADDTVRGSFAAWAIGFPDGYIIMEHQVTVIHVTAADVARGVVEVRGASRLIVTTHATSRYAVDFLNRSTVFRLIGIDGMGGVAQLSPRGASVTQQSVAGRHVIALDYQFALAPGTSPGTYPWPVALTARSVVSGDATQIIPNAREFVLSAQPPRGRRMLLRPFDCGALLHESERCAPQIDAVRVAPVTGPSSGSYPSREEALDP